MHHQSNSQEKISTQLHIDGLYGWLVHPTTPSTCAAKFIFLPFCRGFWSVGSVLIPWRKAQCCGDASNKTSVAGSWKQMRPRFVDELDKKTVARPKRTKKSVGCLLEGPRNMDRMIWFQDVGWQLMVKHSAYSALSQRSGDLSDLLEKLPWDDIEVSLAYLIGTSFWLTRWGEPGHSSKSSVFGAWKNAQFQCWEGTF